MSVRAALVVVILITTSSLLAQSVQPTYSLSDSQVFVKTYCQGCHQGAKAPGRLDLSVYATDTESITKDVRVWGRVLERVRETSMPPKGVKAPAMDEREKFVAWLDTGLREAVCSTGPTSGPAPLRRLNRTQYSNTIRDLLDMQFDAGRNLPQDGSGGEGFDNAAETLFLSPVHAEKYLASAKEVVSFAFKNTRTREKIVTARPGPGVSANQAATQVLKRFLARAFRRPVTAEDVTRYLALFSAAQKRGDSFDASIQYALEAVLMAPEFLFRIEGPNSAAGTGPALLGDYELASRLSYFLWNSMPDQELFDLAAQGTLHDPDTLKTQIVRMLNRGRLADGGEDGVRLILDAKVEGFAQAFTEQWLGTRALGTEINPNPTMFPQFYDTETQIAIRLEPIMFTKELLVSNLSLLNFIDSKFMMANTALTKLYGIRAKAGAYHTKVDVPEGSHRGGLVSMAAVLAVSSAPERTSPVLRGKWILESLLGTPPPAPPPSVPQLKDNEPGAVPQTVRERLAQHRATPSCASCHNSIDPLGFALENFDVLGRWRTEDGGRKIDAAGELPDGTRFDGPEELKAMLMSRKDVFIKNLTTKMLGYALGRGLTLQDSCTVDAIVTKLKQDDYKAQTLVTEIVLSMPFRYQTRTESTP
jgi:uncharacterized protein DUF1588/uncharacterized protein DUF1585/uncharacterized protein DUF1587/uncharacterized protein DUF1595/uncharacterized protein DUF1592